MKLYKEYKDDSLHRRFFSVNEAYDVEIRDLNETRHVQFKEKNPLRFPRITYSKDSYLLSFSGISYMDNEFDELVRNIHLAADAINKTKDFINAE